MAQSSPNNLRVDLTVDSAQAKAQLKEFQAYVSKYTADLRAAVRAGNQADIAAARSALQEAIRLQDQQSAVVKKTQAAFDAHAIAVKEATLANHQHSESLKQMGLEFAHLSHSVGLPIEGLKAIKFGLAGLVAAETIRDLKTVSDRITELVEVSKQTGFDTSTIQAFGRAIQDAGGKASDAVPALKKLGDAYNEMRKQQVDAQREADRAARDVLNRPGGTSAQAAEASQKVLDRQRYSIGDLGDALRQLGITYVNTAKDGKGFDQFLTQVAQGLTRLNQQGRIDEANQYSVQLLGKNYRELGKALEEAGKPGGLDALKKALGGGIVSPQDIAANEAYVRSLNALTDALNEFTKSAFVAAVPQVVQLLTDFTAGLRATQGQIQAFAAFLEPVVGPIVRIIDQLTAAFMRMQTTIGEESRKDVWPLVTGAATAVTGAVAAVGGGPASPVINQASGGYIRGPGSGTSDSILARVSNGEFVLNAGSVRRLGIGYLEQLNSYANGGLVSLPQISFAQGGAVTTPGGGGTLHLHIGDAVFGPFTGDDAMLGRLGRASARKQMASTGVKPTWYGR